MIPKNRSHLKLISKSWLGIFLILFISQAFSAGANTLSEIKRAGVLRHLGVPYANFVTGSGDGLDVELTTLFAAHLGVKYEYVKTSWGSVITDLTGIKFKVTGDDVEILGYAPVKGDMIANGLTILGWRQKLLDYSTPIFPSQVWLMATAASTIKPIKPSDNIEKAIASVKKTTQRSVRFRYL